MFGLFKSKEAKRAEIDAKQLKKIESQRKEREKVESFLKNWNEAVDIIVKELVNDYEELCDPIFNVGDNVVFNIRSKFSDYWYGNTLAYKFIINKYDEVLKVKSVEVHTDKIKDRLKMSYFSQESKCYLDMKDSYNLMNCTVEHLKSKIKGWLINDGKNSIYSKYSIFYVYFLENTQLSYGLPEQWLIFEDSEQHNALKQYEFLLEERIRIEKEVNIAIDMSKIPVKMSQRPNKTK